MQSISVFIPTGMFDLSDQGLKDLTKTSEETVNDVTETLTFELFVNEKLGEFTRCRIRMDEVVPIRARVLNTKINELIVNNAYEIFVNEDNGTLIILANRKSADSIISFMSAEFHQTYKRNRFDLMSIINDSSNVKRAQFRNLLIETIHGSSLSGNRVTDTEMYDLMLNSGELSTIAVVYPFNNTEIKFSISDSGSIVLFSNIEIEEILDWVSSLLS